VLEENKLISHVLIGLFNDHRGGINGSIVCALVSYDEEIVADDDVEIVSFEPGIGGIEFGLVSKGNAVDRFPSPVDAPEESGSRKAIAIGKIVEDDRQFSQSR